MERIRWSRKSYPRLSPILDSRGAAFALMAGVTTMGVLGSVLAIKFELGSSVSGVLMMAPIISIPLMYVWLAHRLSNATQVRTVEVGADGLVDQRRFIPWSAVQSVEHVSRAGAVDRLVLELREGPPLVLFEPPTELIDRVRAHKASHSALEEPPELSGHDLAAGTDHYRKASRPLLVRVASSPKTPAEQRVQAANALRNSGALEENVWDALEESAAPSIRAFLDRHGPGP